MEQRDLVAQVGRVHGRTYEAAELVPEELVAWRPRPGEFTAGELLLHIANARLLNLGIITGAGVHYGGHGLAPGQGRDWLLQRLLRTSKKTIAGLVQADLEQMVLTVSGGTTAVPAWLPVLGGLIEHEVHHRSQLCEYLGMAGIAPPPLYGLHAEDLPA